MKVADVRFWWSSECEWVNTSGLIGYVGIPNNTIRNHAHPFDLEPFDHYVHLIFG